jgi:hypothetical protein
VGLFQKNNNIEYSKPSLEPFKVMSFVAYKEGVVQSFNRVFSHMKEADFCKNSSELTWYILLQQAAGIFSHLKGTVMLAIQQDPTPDLNPETLGALSALMLAQGQEVFVQKAVHGMRLSSFCLFNMVMSVFFFQTFLVIEDYMFMISFLYIKGIEILARYVSNFV